MIVNGWTFDPSRERWWAKTGENTWTEIAGALDDPPSFPASSVIVTRLPDTPLCEHESKGGSVCLLDRGHDDAHSDLVLLWNRSGELCNRDGSVI